MNDMTIPDAVEAATNDAAPESPQRRRILAFAVSAPVMTIAAGFGANLASPSTAHAALPLPLTPPDTVDYYDVGDSLVQTALPTMPLVKLSVGTDGVATLDLPRLESGQGIATAVGMMVAEELDLPLAMVVVTASDARPELVFNQISGGSSAVRSFAAAMPLIAASARARLLNAASIRLGVSASSLTVRAGVVIAADGRSIPYGELTALAATLPLPVGVPKPKSQYKVVGKPANRLDARDIVLGRKKFTMDQDVPNAKPTVLRMPTQIRGTTIRVNNEAAVRAMPGVLAVVVVPGGGTIVPNPPGVAVMAETFGQAWDAGNALDVTWGDGPLKGQSNETILAKCKAAIAPLAIPPLGALTVEGDFTFAPATHAPLEVECAIADVRANSAEIWAGLQTPIVCQQAIAVDLGLPVSAVKVHVVPSGGSFGRRLFWDPVQVAAQVSKASGRICKLMYLRANDMRHTRLRPPQYHKVRATILLGQVIAYEQRVAAVRLDARHGFGELFSAAAGAAPPGVQQSIGNLAYEEVFFKTMVASPYNFGVGTKVLTPVNLDMNTVSYRSVHIQPARSVEEIIVDEIAAKLGKDPLAFRLTYLRLPRARAVLQAVADAGNWGRSMPAGTAQGIAVHQESRSFIACLVEIDCTVRSAPRVTRATIAVDVGDPINPRGIEAQAEGGLAEAISLVLTSGLHVQDGLPLEGSYSQYHFGRQKNYPTDVKVIVMPANGGAIGGMGEVGLSAASGAVANAWARATGTKPRNFPLIFPVDFAPFPPGAFPQRVIVPVQP